MQAENVYISQTAAAVFEFLADCI